MKIRIAIISIMLSLGAGCTMGDPRYVREIKAWHQAVKQRMEVCNPVIEEKRVLKEKSEQLSAEGDKLTQEFGRHCTDLDNFFGTLTDEEGKALEKIDFEKAGQEEYLKYIETLTPVFGPPEKSEKCLKYTLINKQLSDWEKRVGDWKQRGEILEQKTRHNQERIKECRAYLESVMRWAERTMPYRGYSSSYYRGRSPSFDLWEQHLQQQKERDFQHQLDGMRFDMEMQLDTIRRERENRLRNMEIERERQQYWDSYFK